MKDKLFDRLLAVILILGCVSVIVLLVYTVIRQRDASMISYIANGR